MRISEWAKVKTFQLFVHLIALLGAIFYWNIKLFCASIVCWFVMYLFGGSIGAHRLWSHKSFETTAFIKYATLILGTMMGLGSVLGWVGQHRLHHANSDKSIKDDPYWSHNDYSILGTIKSWVMSPHSLGFKVRTVKDLMQDKWVCFTHKYYFQLLFAWIGLLTLISPMIALYCWFIPSVFCYVSAQVSGVFGHRFGKTIYAETNDQSKDCHWLNIFSLGEGYQNTHHRYPNKIIMGKYDLAGFIIDRFLIKQTSKIV